MGDSGIKILSRILERIFVSGITCIFALGGAIVGMITRAITGQTTETGFVRGAGIGAVAGAIVAVELLESLLNGDSSSKVGMFGSLINGKIFREWVCPAMLKAYQWQVGTLETSYMEISDIFDVQGTRGMPPESVDKLPKFNIIRNGTVDHCGENNSCSICLQDFNEGETARELPNCKHLFHLLCIDGWLIIQASCPVCRKDV
ncbi:NEP1-interacting protein 1-like isoform X2 [Papaver somniferum]|uniref:NEP1-interacting protein 1-like isoform X2 n=2 Tax=Papaver somniferum TaxID=3469 RepID=UPI000E6FFE8D|nr:NEP1-interacting protein 1-like isoform X2 [Papaver somniferum]